MSNLIQRFNAKKPCPVCAAGSKGCSATSDGLHFCRGINSDVPPNGWREVKGSPDGIGFRHFRRVDDPPTVRPVRGEDRPKPPVMNWNAKAEQFHAAMNDDARAELAGSLGIPITGLNLIPLIGMCEKTDKGRVFTFPEYDAAGNIIGISKRYPDGKKQMVKGSQRGLTLPADWKEKSGPIFVVEGASDVLAMSAAGLTCLGRPSNVGGAELLVELFNETDREIVIVGENDRKESGQWPGRDGAKSVASKLAGSLGRQIALSFPPEGFKDVREWLKQESFESMPWHERGEVLRKHLLDTIQFIQPPLISHDSETPEIIIGADEYRVNAEAVASLAHDEDLYQRGGMLVRIVEVQTQEDDKSIVRRPDATPAIKALPNPLLRDRLTRCANWKSWNGKGENAVLIAAHPPDWCVSAVGAMGSWPKVRRLEAVVPHPVLLSNGKVLATKGYDAGSCLLVTMPEGLVLNVPNNPTPSDVKQSVEQLNDVVCDFPFENDAHRASWFAGLLTPLAWFAFEGPSPLFLIDANVRAAGKGLLADVASLIITGRRFPIMSYTSDREELRKRILSLAVEGERMVLLDNLAGNIGNDVLDSALTADRLKDRILGGNKVYDGPLHICWYATGNNVQMQADTARRVCYCRLESPHERPESRNDLRRENLREYVKQHRGKLLSAALTILRGWIVAGRPKNGLAPWGSFEGWSSVVREAVVFAGLPDPGETRINFQSKADRDSIAMSALIDALDRMDVERKGKTTAEIIEAIRKAVDPVPDWVSELRTAIEDLCGKLDSLQLGYKFRHYARRNFNGRMLDKSSAPHGANRWVVLLVNRQKNPHHHHHAHASTNSIGGDCGDGDHSPAETSAKWGLAQVDISAIQH